jgi:aromatic-L-amino-acid decarboxylase
MDILRRAFSLVPEYLRTTEDESVRNGMDYGIQLGRRFRALKLWMIIRYFGHEGLASRIREHCRLARLFAQWVEDEPGWEVLAPVPFSTVCFRACPSQGAQEKEARAETEEARAEAEEARTARLDAFNEALMHRFNATGKAFISHTRLGRVLSLRLAIGNIRTTEAHVRRAWELLQEQAAALNKKG